MMSSGHGQQIEILLWIVALLFGIILTVIFLNVLKNARREDKEQVSYEEKADILPKEHVGEEVVTEVTPAQPAVSPEKDVDLKAALRNTEENLFGRIRKLFASNESSNNLDEIEEILYTSDLGPATVQRLMEALSDKLSKKEKSDYETVRSVLKEEIKNIFADSSQADVREGILAKINFASEGPTVIMVVGVNGAGKTTSIGKIASQLASEGKKVLVAAGDTFRAAAGGQLKVWTERAQVEIFSPDGVTDPSAVAFDAVSKGKTQGYDVVIVDTAGRLHTQANLMEEIRKMKRVMTKVIPEAPHETLIVLDANSGQNALMQAKEFHNALTLTGAVLTKMDGTAKGGVAVGLAQELHIPIKLIGVGERIQDLRSFSSQEFVDSIFQM